MARTSTRTFLSLDRYAKILGINPMHFNGGGHIQLSDGRVLFPIDGDKNPIWPQYSWQKFDMTSREELSSLINVAEQNIVDYLGYYPAPFWTCAERHDMPRSFRPEYKRIAYDTALNEAQIKIDHAYLISGGRRGLTMIDASADVIMADVDHDGFNERATIAVTVPAGINPIEVKLYFAGHSGLPEYELRDPKSKTVNGNLITFVFDSWLLIDPEVHEALPTNDDENVLEMTDPDIYVTTVEAYREFNDISQPHVKFIAEYSTGSQPATSDGFFYRVYDDYFVVPKEGSYDAVNNTWTVQSGISNSSDYADLWYYSGMRSTSKNILTADDYLSDDFAMAIAYMATARLERPFWSNDAVTARISNLMEDMSRPPEKQYYNLSPEHLNNPFGTRRGEIMAWKAIKNYKPLKRTGGML